MRTLLFTVAIIASAACTVDMSEPELSQIDQKVKTINRLATNRLATNRLATNRLATNRLATNSLAGLVAFPETSEIVQTEEGRDVYSYVVGCALPFGTTITATGLVDDNGDPANDANGHQVCDDPNDPSTCENLGNYECIDGTCKFFGSLSLAPEWLDKKLGPQGKGWISACLFSRVNRHMTTQGISLRGRHASLATTPDERENFGVEEGAFYGNIFIDDPSPGVEPEWFACSGEGVHAGAGGGLENRDCTVEDPAVPGKTMCGFNYAGPCRDFTPQFPSAYACRQFNADQTIYGDCHEAEGNGKWVGNNKKYRHVITSYVAN